MKRISRYQIHRIGYLKTRQTSTVCESQFINGLNSLGYCHTEHGCLCLKRPLCNGSHGTGIWIVRPSNFGRNLNVSKNTRCLFYFDKGRLFAIKLKPQAVTRTLYIDIWSGDRSSRQRAGHCYRCSKQQCNSLSHFRHLS